MQQFGKLKIHQNHIKGMEANLQTPEIPAHWFSNKEEMHQLLEEWMMAYIATQAYQGMDVKQHLQHFVLYSYLQQSIRSVTLVE